MHQRYNFIFQPLFLIIDLALLIVMYQLASHVWLPEKQPHHIPLESIPLAWIIVTLIFFFYSDRRNQGRKWHLRQISSGFIVFAGIIFLVIVIGKFDVSRGVLLLYLASSWITLSTTTIMRWSLMNAIRKKGFNSRYLAFIGYPKEVQEYEGWASIHPELGYNKTTYYALPERYQEEEVIRKVYEYAGIPGMDELAIGSFHRKFERLDQIIDIAEEFGLRVRLIQDLPKNLLTATPLDKFGPFNVYNIRQEPLNNLFARISKRFMDLVISATVLITIYWWFYVIAGLAIKISSPGPVVFRQSRVGRDGKQFTCFKFRTMRSNGGDPAGDGQITGENDDRVTLIGKFLRKSNLDELPQFYNVLIGEMTVIGPRPHMVEEDAAVSQLLSKYKIRRFVKPGITGWAAVNGYRGGTYDMSLMQKRIDYDIYYIENWSAWLDTKIFFLTIWQMLTFTTKAY